MYRDAVKEGRVSNKNSEVAGMTEILVSFPGIDVSCVACNKTDIAVNTRNVWDFGFTDILQ
jgi:hypothetical protein